MVIKTRSQKAKPRRGRPKSSPESCGTPSYLKKTPNSSLKKCKKNQTCKKVEGKSGKRCQLKKKRTAKKVGGYWSPSWPFPSSFFSKIEATPEQAADQYTPPSQKQHHN